MDFCEKCDENFLPSLMYGQILHLLMLHLCMPGKTLFGLESFFCNSSFDAIVSDVSWSLVSYHGWFRKGLTVSRSLLLPLIYLCIKQCEYQASQYQRKIVSKDVSGSESLLKRCYVLKIFIDLFELL